LGPPERGNKKNGRKTQNSEKKDTRKIYTPLNNRNRTSADSANLWKRRNRGGNPVREKEALLGDCGHSEKGLEGRTRAVKGKSIEEEKKYQG